MKHAYLSVFLGLTMLAPGAALAQTDGEEPAETPPAEGEQTGETAGEEAAEGETTESTEEQPSEATQEQAEQAAPPAPPPEPAPEPELSAAEQGGASDLAQPTVEDDLADADAEVDMIAEDEADDGEAEEEEEKLPWRNSLFLWDNSVTTCSIDPSCGLSYNGTYSMAFSLRPRWYLTDDISIRARQDFEWELTDSDLRAVNRELVVFDTRFELVHANLYEFEGATLTAGARVSFPTSKSSRAYQMYMMPGVMASVSRPFEDVMEGLTVGVSTTHLYSVAGSNVRFIEDSSGDASTVPQRVVARPGFDNTPEDIQAGGASAGGYQAILGFSAELSPIENLSVGTSFTWWWTQAPGLAEGCVSVPSSPGGEICVDDGSDTHTRLATWFTLEVGYDVMEWLNASIGYGNLTSEFNPVASRRNPFWSFDSTVSLTATVTLDTLYTEFTEEDVAAADADSENTATASAQGRRGVQ